MIEILVVRDPDSADDIRVWENGRELRTNADGLYIAYVDAGAGYEYRDWVEMADAAVAEMVTDEVKVATRAAFDDPPGRKYIDGFPLED